MRASAVFLCLLLFPAAAMADADSDYAALVAKAEAGDATVDYTALRKAYTQTSKYDPYSVSWLPLIRETYAALSKGDCASALTKADAVLKLDFTAMDAHAVRGFCAGKANDTALDAHEKAILHGLSQSLFTSGDGKTPETALVVTSMGDERFALTALRVRQTRQALVQTAKSPVDEIAGTDAGGNTQKVYFNVSALFEGMGKQLKSKP